MSHVGSKAPQFALSCLLVLGGLLLSPHPAPAQRARPDSGLLPNPNPLCDGVAVPCLDVDDLAAHAYAHLQVLPRTDLRDTAAVVPFGVALGLFGRVAGALSTHYAFWKEGDATYHQLGPLRLNLTLRLWPLFPLWSSGGNTETTEADPSYYAPPRGLRLGLTYEHEVRVWQFDGANSLGLLTDLAAVRLVGSRMFGPLQLSASLGALYDWHGLFATGEAAAQLGLYLPGFRALKIYIEGLGRGAPVHVRKESLPPDLASQELIHPQGLVGLGLSFHPHARVDLGVSVQRGFGGLAPWSVSVNFLTLSLGKTYQGRAATPVPQLAADVAAEAAAALKEFIDKLPIDPKLDENCQILDHDNVTIIGQFGKRTKNGYYCEQDGFLVPIGHELNRDKKSTKLCRDDALMDCLLERHGKQWVPLHRPRLDGACRMTDSDGRVLGHLGEPTPDGKACRYAVEKDIGRYGKYTEFQQQPIGELFYTDADRTAVCVDAAMQRCFMRPPPGRHSLAWADDERAATAFISGGSARLGQRVEDTKQLAQGAARTAADVASGKVKLTTIYEEGKRTVEKAAGSAADIVRDPEQRNAAVAAAVDKVDQLKKAAEAWTNKPPEQQMEDIASAAGGSVVDFGINTAVGGAIGLGSHVAGLANVARKGKRAEEALADAAKAGRKGAKAAAEAGASPHLTSRAARREAMRQAGIPTSQQPIAQTRTIAGMQYEYDIKGKGGKQAIGIVTDQTTDRVAGHGPHWEAGIAKDKHERDPLGRLRVRNGKSKVEYMSKERPDER